MTQEEKELLLKDLSARLPYGVKYKTYLGDTFTLKDITLSKTTTEYYIDNNAFSLNQIKPYLRPMSSMDSEEIETYRAIIGSLLENSVTDNVSTLYNFLNSKHLDYNGLIFRGLALEAPKDMYNTKN